MNWQCLFLFLSKKEPELMVVCLNGHLFFMGSHNLMNILEIHVLWGFWDIGWVERGRVVFVGRGWSKILIFRDLMLVIK